MTAAPGRKAPPARMALASLVCVLTLAAFPAPGRRAAAAARTPTDQDAIEQAFQRCDVGSLKGAFSPRVKPLLDSHALGVRQGYYGADQTVLMLKRAFGGRSTVRFRITAPDAGPTDRTRRILSARWLYRDEGAPKTDARLAFTLAREGSGWYIREIREQP